MKHRLLLILLILLTPAYLLGQPSVPKNSFVVATEELDAIISEAQKLNNKTTRVNITARAAMLVSFADPARAETMFLALWKFANAQTDETFDKEEAQLLILKNLFSRNPKLARQLLAEQRKTTEASSGNRGPLNDTEQRSTSKLASVLAEPDPSSAAALLEDSLSLGVTPLGVAALSRLRETNSFLSDYVAAKVIDRLLSQPTLVSLPSLFMLGGYVFPGSEEPMTSVDAESSLQLLQFRYFVASHDVLRASLAETNEALLKNHQYTQPQLQFRAAYQAQVAAVLAALAPRFQPSLGIELTTIAGKLAPQVPANMPQLSRFTLSRIGGTAPTSDDPETNFFTAISNGDFDEASKQLERIKDGETKDAYTQLFWKAQAKALLAKSDVMGALTAIRKLQDQTLRLATYLEAMKAIKKKNDQNLSNIVVNEARLLVPQTNRNGIHVRAILSFSAQLANPGTKDDAVEFLNSAVVAINALARKSNEEADPKTAAQEAMAELNKPDSLLDSAEFAQAFNSVGRIDFERVLEMANKIEMKPVQLLARLETIHSVIKSGPAKSKRPANRGNVSSSSKQ